MQYRCNQLGYLCYLSQTTATNERSILDKSYTKIRSVLWLHLKQIVLSSPGYVSYQCVIKALNLENVPYIATDIKSKMSPTTLSYFLCGCCLWGNYKGRRIPGEMLSCKRPSPPEGHNHVFSVSLNPALQLITSTSDLLIPSFFFYQTCTKFV